MTQVILGVHQHMQAKYNAKAKLVYCILLSVQWQHWTAYKITFVSVRACARSSVSPTFFNP